MYKRNAQGWSRHFDFMIIDEISLQIAFILATLIRNHLWAYSSPLYRQMGIGDFIRRTSLDEFPQFFLVLKGTLSAVGNSLVLGVT